MMLCMIAEPGHVRAEASHLLEHGGSRDDQEARAAGLPAVSVPRAGREI